MTEKTTTVHLSDEELKKVQRTLDVRLPRDVRVAAYKAATTPWLKATKKEKGRSRFVFRAASYGVVDHQYDRLLPRCCEQSIIRWGYTRDDGSQSPGHDPLPFVASHDITVGGIIGRITRLWEEKDGLYAEAEIQSDLNDAAQAAEKLITRGLMTEFSIHFSNLVPPKERPDGSTDVIAVELHEISCVLLGASPNTGIVAGKLSVPRRTQSLSPLKGDAFLTRAKELLSTPRKRATAVSEGPTRVDTESQWNPYEMLRRLPSDADAAVYRQMFAWVMDAGNPDQIDSYGLPHHQVSVSGSVEAANLAACYLGIDGLNRDASRDAGREAAYNHLAAHIRAADREPPELDRSDPEQLDEPDEEKVLRIPADPFEARLVITAVEAYGTDSDIAIEKARQLIERERQEDGEREKARAEVERASTLLTTHPPQPENVVKRLDGYSSVMESQAERGKREHEAAESEAKQRERQEELEEHRRFKREERERMRVGTLPFTFKDSDK